MSYIHLAVKQSKESVAMIPLCRTTDAGSSTMHMNKVTCPQCLELSGQDPGVNNAKTSDGKNVAGTARVDRVTSGNT